MYRFRSIEKILGRKELEDQYIYFSDSASLNDPMEGFRHIFWRGDVILWRNLFHHYLFCLEHTLALSRILPPEEKLTGNHIPVFGTKSDLPTKEQQDMHDEIRTEFLTPLVEKYLSLLAARSGQMIIGRNELFAHLRMIHLYALHCILVVYNRHHILGAPPDDLLAEQIKSLEEMVGMLETIASGTQEQRENSSTILSMGKGLDSQVYIRQAYNAFVKNQNPRWTFVTHGFIGEYIIQVEKLLFHEIYIACFMKECTNPAVWAHYADSHRGVALKFRPKENDGFVSLNLTGATGATSNSGYIPMESECRLRKIEYTNSFADSNFFTSIGRLRIAQLYEQWYVDAFGMSTPLANEVLAEPHRTKWKAEYWQKQHDAFYKKLKSWEYEAEWRITLSDIGGSLDAIGRKVKYRFTELDGIIFGARTSMDDKLEIIRIVEKNCAEAKYANFNFYQSQFNSATGEMEIVALNLLNPSPK